MDLEVKVLNLEQMYDDISLGEILIIYVFRDENTVKMELNVKNKNENKIVLEDTNSNLEIVWDRSDFIINKYKILDIVRENRFLIDQLPNQVYNVTLEDLQPKLINLETQYIQKADYQQIYPINEQVEVINQYYLSKINNPSKFAYSNIQKKAQNLGDLIDNYKFIPKSTDNPILEQFEYGHFYSPLLRPIVFDCKYIFDEKFIDDIEDVRNYIRSNEDVSIINNIIDITSVYEKSSEEISLSNEIKYNEFHEILIYGSDNLPTPMKKYEVSENQEGNKIVVEKLVSNIDPMYSSYIPIYQTDREFLLPGYKFRSSDFDDVYRYITPQNPLNGLTSSLRRIQGSKLVIYDRPDKTLIGEKVGSRECHGTAKTSESKYFNPADKYVPIHDGIVSNFNNSISKEPEVVIATKGEDLYIVGMYLQSPYTIQPTNNLLIKKNKYVDKSKIDYYIDNKNGPWNVLDRVIQSRQHKLKKQILETTINLENNQLNIDYTVDNIIYFNTEQSKKYLTKDEFIQQYTKIIPDTNKILSIEDINIKNINNITDLNKILSKYFLSIKNLDIQYVKNIEQILNNRYIGYKESNEKEKIDSQYYIDINKKIQTVFNNVYHTLFSIDKIRNISISDISKLLLEYFKQYDKSLIDHILKYYFGVDAIYNTIDEGFHLFIQQFFNRYSNYLYSNSPVRLLLIPGFSIEDEFIQKYADFIKRFYNFDNIRHNPSNIGLINELYHNMYVKDSSEHFNYFAEYVYATNGFYKILDNERTLLTKYPDIDYVKSLLETASISLNTELLKYKLQHSRCLDYNLSKFYSNFNKLIEDNDRPNILVDKLFDKTSTINAIFAKNGENSLIKIKEVYPFETDEWYSNIIEALKQNNGKLNGAFVEDGMFALLVDNEKYDIYERLNNKWVFKLNVPESCRVEVAMSGKKSINYKPPKHLSVLCHLEGTDATLVDEIAQLLNYGHEKGNDELKLLKCAVHENTCLPKVIISMYKDIELYKTIIKTITYYEKQKEIYANIAFERRKKLEVILNKYENSKDKKLVMFSHIESNIEPINPQYKLYNNQWSLISNISDIDVRYSEMEKFISNHGLFKRKLIDGSIQRVDNDDWIYVYYDIIGITNPLCCRHYLLQVKQAWQSNIERNKLQLLLENSFGVINSELRYIYCKNCGETIGLNRESDMEGFDGDDNVIRVREAVFEFFEGEDDYSYLFKSKESELHLNLYNNILLELSTILNFKLNRDTTIKIINNSSAMYNKEYINIFDFEYALYMNNKKYFTPEVLSLFTKTTKSATSKSATFYDTYVEARNRVIPDKSIMTEDVINSLTSSVSGPSKFIKNAFGSLSSETSPNTIVKCHVDYLANNMVMCVVLNLLACLINSEPEIKIQPSGERFSSCRISNVSNYILNQELLIDTFAKILDCTAKGVSNKESVFYRFKDYYSGQLSSEIIKQLLINLFDDTFSNDKAYMIQHRQKEEKYKKELDIARLSLSESTTWKTFRPIMKLGNVKHEIDKINLNTIQQKITDKSTTLVEYNYIAFQLSYYLFYSIQSIIESEPIYAGQSFSNFCCLNNLKSNYIDYFTSKNQNIELCIQLMAQIQPNAFYNPNQQAVTIIKDTIEIIPPRLLDYFQDAEKLLNSTELKDRITKLFKIYGLFEGENGEKRLYSKFYDEYLSMVSNKSRSEIVEILKTSNEELSETDITNRVDNLFNTNDPGLIVEDIVSGHYLWDINDKISIILENKTDIELMSLYNDLLKKLYISSHVFINKKAYDPIAFKYNYDSILEQKEQILKQYKELFNEIKLEIENFDGGDIYREFLELNEKFQSIQVSQQNIDSVFKDFANYVVPNIAGKKKPLEEVGIDFDLTRVLSGCLNNHEEKKDNLVNQIQIEGYRSDEIQNQYEIRKNALLLDFNYNSFDQLKKYYLIVSEVIFKFVNWRLRDDNYSFIGIDNHKKHKELSDIVNKGLSQNLHIRDYKIKDLIYENPIYKNLSIDQLEQVNKIISYNTMNKLSIFVNRNTSVDNSLIECELFKPGYILFIIYYFIQKSIINLISISVDREMSNFLTDFVNEFIIDELNRVVEINCMTNKEVRNHLRELIKKENDRRKKRVEQMKPARKMQYQLYRANGLGDFFPNQEMDNVDEYSTFGMNETPEESIQQPELVQLADDEIVAGDVSAVSIRDDAFHLQLSRRVNDDTEEVNDENLRADDFEE